jgi:hypothetical protein
MALVTLIHLPSSDHHVDLAVAIVRERIASRVWPLRLSALGPRVTASDTDSIVEIEREVPGWVELKSARDFHTAQALSDRDPPALWLASVRMMPTSDCMHP